tara:strand:- start:1249 stop:1713 length:465 start_codon:yes stop_codon:yes gene_type:complete
MINILSYKTSQLSNKLINNILELKNSHWKRGMKSQKRFFKNNILRNDFHVLLLFKNKLSGYVLLRKKKYIFKNKKYNYLHFDTLIIKKNLRNKKLSPFLMSYVNSILNLEKKISFLYCDKNMFGFYKKYGWKKTQKKKFKLSYQNNKKILLIHI